MKPSSPFPPALRTVVVVLSVLVVAASAALVLTFGHGRDQSIYAVVARETLAGGMPYRDAFDFKPPGIFLVYGLARVLAGSSVVGVRILEVGAMLATTLALLRLARRELHRPLVGWVAAALAAGIHAQLDFWHTGQPESFAGPLGLWALALAADFYRAIALHHLGRNAEAQSLLTAATRSLRPAPDKEAVPLIGETDPHQIVAWLAHREARRLMTSSTDAR